MIRNLRWLEMCFMKALMWSFVDLQYLSPLDRNGVYMWPSLKLNVRLWENWWSRHYVCVRERGGPAWRKLSWGEMLSVLFLSSGLLLNRDSDKEQVKLLHTDQLWFVWAGKANTGEDSFMSHHLDTNICIYDMHVEQMLTMSYLSGCGGIKVL